MSVVTIGKRVSKRLGSVRAQEYEHVMRFIGDAPKVLDAGCGTGTLLAMAPDRFVGIDLNPDNAEYCQKAGLKAETGNALDLQFPDESFDAAVCSHVMQALSNDDAATLIRELGRVVKPGGVVVITTLNWFVDFFRHPENVRAYPPAALNAYFASQRGAQSPMFTNMPDLVQSGIWLRRPALFRLRSARRNVNRVYAILNRVQYRLGLRRWWTYDSYIVKLTKAA